MPDGLTGNEIRKLTAWKPEDYMYEQDIKRLEDERDALSRALETILNKWPDHPAATVAKYALEPKADLSERVPSGAANDFFKLHRPDA